MPAMGADELTGAFLLSVGLGFAGLRLRALPRLLGYQFQSQGAQAGLDTVTQQSGTKRLKGNFGTTNSLIAKEIPYRS